MFTKLSIATIAVMLTGTSAYFNECPDGCLKVCKKGKACGNGCIRRSYNCKKNHGCACQSADYCTVGCMPGTNYPCGNECIPEGQECHEYHGTACWANPKTVKARRDGSYNL